MYEKEIDRPTRDLTDIKENCFLGRAVRARRTVSLSIFLKQLYRIPFFR